MSGAELDPDGLYHLATAGEWAAYQASGTIAPDSLDTEGFVHCSWGRQVPGTVEKHFGGVIGLLALRLDPAELGNVALVEEDAYGSGHVFPHLYGPIAASGVTEVVERSCFGAATAAESPADGR